MSAAAPRQRRTIQEQRVNALGMDPSIRDRLDLLILLGLACYADRSGVVVPNLDDLARWGECSTWEVSERIGKLEAQGRLRRPPRRRGLQLVISEEAFAVARAWDRRYDAATRAAEEYDARVRARRAP